MLRTSPDSPTVTHLQLLKELKLRGPGLTLLCIDWQTLRKTAPGQSALTRMLGVVEEMSDMGSVLPACIGLVPGASEPLHGDPNSCIAEAALAANEL